MAQRRRSVWHWLVAGLPVGLIGLVIVSWRAPSQTEAYVALAGSWSAVDVATDAEAEERRAACPSADFRTIKVPGQFSKQGLDARHVVLCREVELPAALRDTTVQLSLGYVHRAIIRIFVNGHLIGTRGDVTARFFSGDTDLSLMLVPREFLNLDGHNHIALEVVSFEKVRNGILDDRLLIGAAPVLTPWAFRQNMARVMLESSNTLILMTFLVLVLVLWRLLGARAQKDLYLGAVLMLVASLGYTMGRTGQLQAAYVPFALTHAVTDLSLFLFVFAMVEFVEAYLKSGVSLLRRANRVVAGVAGAVGIALSFVSIDVLLAFHVWFARWTLVMGAYCTYLAVRELIRAEQAFGTVVACSVFATAISGVSDVLVDQGALIAPRMFQLGVYGMAIAASGVVVAEFLAISVENRVLSVTLATKNDQLSLALEQVTENARLKTEFLASTSHELRTPLNTIINVPQAMLEEIAPPAFRCALCQTPYDAPLASCPQCEGPIERPAQPEPFDLARAGRLLQSVVTSGQQLLVLVDDLLDFSELDSNRLELKRTEVLVSTMLEELAEAMRPIAAQAKVTLKVSELGQPVYATLDRARMLQVLSNIVSNAIKFSSAGGEVTVETRALSGRLEFGVKDHGIGIAPEHQKIIFEAFRQVEGGTTRRFGGTGLGLAISKRLVELHGGTIAVTSAPGQGSTFTVTIPQPMTT